MENIKVNRGIDLTWNPVFEISESYRLLARGDTLACSSSMQGPMCSLLKLMEPEGVRAHSAVLALMSSLMLGVNCIPTTLYARTASRRLSRFTLSWKSR